MYDEFEWVAVIMETEKGSLTLFSDLVSVKLYF